MRDRYLTTGTAPSIRALGKESGVPIKELYELFPKGPAKLAAKIGGIPKPKRLHLEEEHTMTELLEQPQPTRRRADDDREGRRSSSRRARSRASTPA